MSSEDEEGTANWFYSGDTDGDDLLSLDEFTQLLESTGDDDDENEPPTPEEAMAEVDTDDDGYMSYQEFQDAWESDPENFELDYDEVTILFDDCDYDDNDLIDIDEMQCFIDGIVDMAPDEGDEDPEQRKRGRRRFG
jgi:Ca2+-binding EF-hand superfamily protein